MNTKINIGVLRGVIDTEENYFLFQEEGSFKVYNPIYLFFELRRIRRKLNGLYRCSYYRIPYRDYMITSLSRESLEGIEDFIRAKDIRLLYMEFLSDALSNLLLLKKTKLPIIANYRGFELSDRGVIDFLEQISDLLSRIITRSNFQKKELQKAGVRKDKIEVVYDGVDLQEIAFKLRDVDKRRPNLLSAGRFVEKKGFDTTLRFFKNFSRLYPSSKLTLVGDGVLRDKIENYIRRFGLSDRVVMKSFMDHDDFAKELYKHDIFILPSKTARSGDREGIPNVLKEAMASGMPVVSTYHAGIPELISDEKTGFLVQEDDDRALLKKVEYILNNAAKTKTICRNARAWVEKKFDVSKGARQIEDIMSKLQ